MTTNDRTWANSIARAHDPEDPMNGPQHHTGLPCVERSCQEPAGTAWGPSRCQRHNAEQLVRFSASLDALAARIDPTAATSEA